MTKAQKHDWRLTNVLYQQKCELCGRVRSIASAYWFGYGQQPDDDCPGAPSPVPNQTDMCFCDIKDLLSVGHDTTCPYNKKK